MEFKHYNAKEVVLGRTMEDWCRFSVCYWHTFRGTGADPFGGQTLHRPWDDMSNSIPNALRRVDAAFEFITKLGVPFYTFHDVDVAPEGATLKESNENLDKVVDYLEKKQKETGVKLLWGTANMFSHSRFAQGAATSPDAHVFAYAASKVKKAMEATLRLGGENYVFWGGREGFQSPLNTRVRQELDNLAAFLHMAVEHKKNIGAKFQFLIEPKPREPSGHQYDYDAQTVWGFLKSYGLDAHFKVNIEPNHTTLAGHSYEHDLIMSSKFGYLGSSA
jgi:xylose isomerase